MVQVNEQTIRTKGGDNEAQALIDPVLAQIPQAESEQPILTQQKVMDLIMQQQALSNNTSGSIMASTWATKKQGFTDMLSGFRSPTGTTYRVALDLASVLFVSVAAADANRMSLMAQNEAQQRLVAQAERHRETLEKEFTLNLERIKEENQKTLDQTIRIREELMKSCQPVNNAGMLEKMEGNQGEEIVKFQLKFMQARAERLEKDLQDNKEKHESDMLKLREDNKKKEKDLERERSKIKVLEKDLKQCEDSIMGMGLPLPLLKEPEVEQIIKIEEPELKRFKKDDVLRAKTRKDNLEKDEEIARQEDNLAREKDNLAREKDNLAREKDNLAREKDNLAREKDNLAREKDNLAREKDSLARDVTPARERKPRS
jgi:hypothetical protein